MQYLQNAGLLLAILCFQALASPDPTPRTSSPPQQLRQSAGFDPLDVQVGRALFQRLWVAAPASTQAADGLGPLYEARACSACHPRNGRAAGPIEDGQALPVGLVLRIDRPPLTVAEQKRLTDGTISNLPDPVYGAQFQRSAVAGLAAEAVLSVAYTEHPVTLADGTRVTLRSPDYQVSDTAYGPLHPQARLSPRIAPPLFGLGLLDALDEQSILARADPEDADGDGISGRANRAWSHQRQRLAVGRFGHKAGQPDLDQQIQSAFSTDLGLSVPLYPDPAGDCTDRQAACREAPHGDTPRYDSLEAHARVTELVHLYLAHLKAPQARTSPDAGTRTDLDAGARLFQQAGCADCHTPNLQTANHSPFPALRNRHIAPYSDLLLHDLGEGLADHRPEARADGSEWRTAPLWGIGMHGNRHFLHDGRARTLLEAILWHGGEGRAARDRVAGMDRQQRRQLLAFLESL